MLTSSNIITNIQNNYTVETEIYLLYVAILIAKDSGYNTVIVNNTTVTAVNGTDVTGSPITLDITYYSVWQNNTIDNRKSIEMQKVIDNFTQLGYTINRKSDDMEHLYWQINW